MSWPAAIFVEKKQPPREKTTVFCPLPGMALAAGGCGSPAASGPAFGPAAKQPRPPKTVGPPPTCPPGWSATGGVKPNSPAPYGPAFGPLVISKLVRNGEKASSDEMTNSLSASQ